MSATALALVLTAAFAHALWNFILKRSGGGIGFIWLFALLATLVYGPLAIGLVWHQWHDLGWLALGFIALSALIHTGYFLLLDRGYRHGDLSVVYPVARASGPFLTVIFSIVLLGERPGPLALAGAAAIIIGALYISGLTSQVRRGLPLRGIVYALLTGLMIAAYTICDQRAVTYAAIPPVLLHWGENFGRTLMLTPMAVKNRAAVVSAWQKHKKAALAAAVLSPLAYILALTAMTFTPVSYIAPAREISIIIGAWLGTQVLGEADAKRRMIAATMMAAGMAGLAIG
ncbi:MAG: EamA family transporter [Betaproteobacteria bacterium]|nr:EamA family transporter [Betaproteobacteria bacterium]